MACPFVVGVIALMLSKHRKQEKAGGFNNCKTIEDIKQHLLKYTIDKGEKGKDNSWGYGIINVKDLIIEDSNPEPNPEPKPNPDPNLNPNLNPNLTSPHLHLSLSLNLTPDLNLKKGGGREWVI